MRDPMQAVKEIKRTAKIQALRFIKTSAPCRWISYSILS